MNTNVRAIHDGGQQAACAISFCLYPSSRWNPARHIEPLKKALQEKADGKWKEFDFLIHLDPTFRSLIEALPAADGIRIFQAEESVPGFCKHLYRYFGGKCDYDWVLYRGSDEPVKGIGRWQQLVRIANELNLKAITVLCRGEHFRAVMGACAMRNEVGKKFLGFLERLPTGRLDAGAGNWNIDEALLSEWFERANQPRMIVIRGPIFHFQAREYLLQQLFDGPKTMIITGQSDW